MITYHLYLLKHSIFFQLRSIKFQDSNRSELHSDDTNWSDSTVVGGSRPTRQCINRSIPYRYIQEDDEDDE